MGRLVGNSDSVQYFFSFNSTGFILIQMAITRGFLLFFNNSFLILVQVKSLNNE